MIPLMRREVVERHGWLTEEDFMNYLVVAQTLPGIFAANMAASVGLRLRGRRGAWVAVVGNIAMPVLTILVLAAFFAGFRHVAVVEQAFLGLRPAVVALIAAPVLSLARSAHLSWRTAWQPALVAGAVWLLGVSPVVIIVVVALGVVACHLWRSRKEGRT